MEAIAGCYLPAVAAHQPPGNERLRSLWQFSELFGPQDIYCGLEIAKVVGLLFTTRWPNYSTDHEEPRLH